MEVTFNYHICCVLANPTQSCPGFFCQKVLVLSILTIQVKVKSILSRLQNSIVEFQFCLIRYIGLDIKKRLKMCEY